MFNIDILSSYENHDVNTDDTDFLISSVQYEEPDSIIQCFIKGAAILLPVLLVLIGLIFIKVKFLNFKFSDLLDIFSISLVFSLFCCIIHKWLYALSYPVSVIKKIYNNPKLIYSFFNFNVHVSKKRFLWICLCPNIILGFLPFSLWMIGIFDFNSNFSQMLIIISMINIFYGTRDYYNAYITLKQVPDEAVIFNYGIHNYWYFPSETSIYNDQNAELSAA